MPSEAEKAEFKAAVEPVFDWFKSSVPGGEDIFASFTAAVEDAEAAVNAQRAVEIAN